MSQVSRMATQRHLTAARGPGSVRAIHCWHNETANSTGSIQESGARNQDSRGHIGRLIAAAVGPLGPRLFLLTLYTQSTTLGR